MQWQQFVAEHAPKPVLFQKVRDQLASTILKDVHARVVTSGKLAKTPQVSQRNTNIFDDIVAYCRPHQSRWNKTPEVKANREQNFMACEFLFLALLSNIKFRRRVASDVDVFESHLRNFRVDWVLFQKAVTTLVRYAPDPETAFQYAIFILEDAPKMTQDERLRIRLTTNLIYVCKSNGSVDAMRQAYKLVESGLRLGYSKQQRRDGMASENHRHDEAHRIFLDVSEPVARSQGMRIDRDNHRLVPILARPSFNH
ncbi:hypothetical protein BC940DRAFT_290944 [Gongronella butleri]|nr:hypothetical protein BC940DRAFT_290944 [Gongronella butleri]